MIQNDNATKTCVTDTLLNYESVIYTLIFIF